MVLARNYDDIPVCKPLSADGTGLAKSTVVLTLPQVTDLEIKTKNFASPPSITEGEASTLVTHSFHDPL